MEVDLFGNLSNMKVLAVIPARGGSKSIPNKNIIEVGGLPLIAWTIRQAIHSGVVDYIHVSTDDENIAMVAREFGAKCDFLRPSNISGDSVGTGDAINHSIAELERMGQSFDFVLELQPTYCFRGQELIKSCISKFNLMHKEIDSLISCVNIQDTSHPDFVLTRNQYGRINFGKKRPDQFARQLLDEALSCRGIILAARISSYKSQKSFFSGNVLPIIVEDRIRSIDINDIFDLGIARFLAESYPETLI